MMIGAGGGGVLTRVTGESLSRYQASGRWQTGRLAIIITRVKVLTTTIRRRNIGHGIVYTVV